MGPSPVILVNIKIEQHILEICVFFEKKKHLKCVVFMDASPLECGIIFDPSRSQTPIINQVL